MYAFLEYAKILSPEKTIFEFGKEVDVNAAKTFIPDDDTFMNDFLSSDWRNRLIFAGRAPQVWQAESPIGGQAGGNLLHLALSMISTAADVEHAVVRLVQQALSRISMRPLRENF
ncbi:MAG: hypothetical protein IPH20_24265 [Bacteroidales bacterium]|nr:hypothetical protein [Bacteroidales bacterium]